MDIRLDPNKVMHDGNTMSVRVGFYFDDQFVSVRVSDEYLTDKFRRPSATPSELVQLAKNDLPTIQRVVELMARSGTVPQNIIVTTADI